MNIRALVALIVLLSVAAIAERLRFALFPVDLPEQSMVLLSISIMLIGGWLAGMVFHSIRLPRICGYLIYGMVIGPSDYTLRLLPSAEHVKDDLGFINYLAISFIALLAGGEIRVDWLRGQLRRIAVLIGVEVSIVLTVAVSLLLLCLPLLSSFSGASWDIIISATILGSIIIISASPTVAIAIISDYRARGPLTSMLLALTIVKDMLLIALFTTAVVIVKGILSSHTSFSLDFLFAIIVQLLGSIAVGALAGFLMAYYVHHVKTHLGMFIIGCCFLFALVGKEDLVLGQTPFHLEPLLIGLSAGLIMQNVYPERTGALFHRVEELMLPVYCLFFTLAGAKVDLGLMRDLWYFAVAMAITRAALIWFAVGVATKAAKITEPWRTHVWLGLIPQAGVTLVLVTLVSEKFAEHAWTSPLVNLLIGMIVCNELFGPIGFRHALFAAGEADDQGTEGRH